MSVRLHYAVPPFAFNHRTLLKQFLANEFKQATKRELNLSIIFGSDAFILEINKRHLNHDYYTDIITFPLSHSSKEIEAEIYISVDRVRENAATYKVSFLNELHRVIFHGLLHLMGYGDKTKAQQAEMRQQEDAMMERYEKYLVNTNPK